MPFMPYVDSQSLVDEDARRKRMYQLQQEPQSIYNQLKNQWFGNDKFAPRAYGDIDLPDNRTRLVPPRPKDPIEYLKNPTAPISKFVNDKLDDYYGPTSNPSGERFSPLTSALGLFSQDFSPEGANPAHGINPGHASEAAVSMVPRGMLKKRAKAIADEAEIHFKNYPQLKRVVQDMSIKHPNIVGNLSRIVPNRQRNTLAAFSSYPNPWSSETVRGLIDDPGKMLREHPDQKVRDYASYLVGQGWDMESRIKKMGEQGSYKERMPFITIGGSQDEANIASNYSTMRHEFSHANDYIYRPKNEGKHYPGSSADYWLSLPEVRARAVERNYGRDMGIKNANKTRAVPFDISGEGEFPALHMNDEDIFHELNAARERFGDKVAAELAVGAKIAENRAGFGAGRRALTSAGKARNVRNARDIAADTYGHYFMPSGQGGGTILKPPMLNKPERFDIHGISQGEFRVPDIIGGLFRY